MAAELVVKFWLFCFGSAAAIIFTSSFLGNLIGTAIWAVMGACIASMIVAFIAFLIEDDIALFSTIYHEYRCGSKLQWFFR